MVRINPLLLLLTSLFITSSCMQFSKKEHTELSNPEFILPQIPAMLTDPESRAHFLATHYWDNFPFADTTYIHLPEITEQALVNFMDVLKHVPEGSAEKAIGILFTKASNQPEMATYFWETIRRYWYDPNSPMRNEKMYLISCQATQGIESLAEKIKIQAEYDCLQLSKNRPGEAAANFSYADPNNNQGELYQIKGEYTLLFFYNPECETCSEMKNHINYSTIFNKLFDEKRLQILALYPDEEYEEWRAHLSEIPNRWINACDPLQQINQKQLYYLQAIPTFYLLDEEKKVLLKDVTIYEVEEFLENKSL
ncbi:MAG: DUF5106 domain-containing protein [Phocaeicola sp.]